MGAVDIGVGHDDDLVVPQIVNVEPRAHRHAQSLADIPYFRIVAQLVRCGPQNVQDLALQGQQGLGLAAARPLGAAPGAVTLDDEQFRPLAVLGRAVGQLARQAQPLGRRFPLGFLFGPAPQPFLGAQDQKIQNGACRFRVGRQPIVEMVADRTFHPARGFLGRQPVLGLADERRLADEDRDQRAAAGQHILARDLTGLAVLDQLAVSAHTLQDRRPEAGLMRAALGRGDGIAIGMQKAVARGRPVDRPFDRSGHAELLLETHAPGKGSVGIGR